MGDKNENGTWATPHWVAQNFAPEQIRALERHPVSGLYWVPHDLKPTPQTHAQILSQREE